MNETVIVALITALGTGGVVAAVVGWLKDRKKDNATAKLTDVEALQKQVVLLTSITDYLRRENAALQVDRDSEFERSRRLARQLSEVQDELDKVRRQAARTQSQCEELSHKIKQMQDGDNK